MVTKKKKKNTTLKDIDAFMFNRFSALADENQQQQNNQKTFTSLQQIKCMKMKQLIPYAKRLNIIGISNKKKHDLCAMIAHALKIDTYDVIEESNVNIEESVLTMNVQLDAMPLTIRKKRAMTSQKASIVKKQGHRNQDRFALLMNGQKSQDHTGKIDIRVQEKTYSLKKECKRIQFALYTISSRRWRNMSHMSEMCKMCLSVLPVKFQEYKNDVQRYKNLLGEKMEDLKESCQDKNKLKELLEIFIRGRSNEVRFVVFHYKGQDYIFQADEMIDKIIQNTNVSTSSKRSVVSEDAQKVVIRNTHNIIEMEIRKSSQTHYREFLCVANRDKLLTLLLNSVPGRSYFKENVILLGKAIKQHE